MSKYETVYRIIKNKDSNDFNNELEFTIEPYYINEDNTKIQRKGFNSWNDITAEIFDSIYWNRKSAEMALVSYMCKTENQKAIECLEDVKREILDENKWQGAWWDYAQKVIDQKISELKGEYGMANSIDKWVVKERNVSICEECGGSMALWYNHQDQQYCVSCDYCPNEYFYTKEEVDWTGVMTKYPKEKKNEE